MRQILALLGLLVMVSPCLAEDEYLAAIRFTETNVYQIRGKVPFLVTLEEPVKVIIKKDPFTLSMRGGDAKELYEVACKLYPGSEIRLLGENEDVIRAEILLSSAWEDKNFKGDSLQGACKRPTHRFFYFSKSFFAEGRRNHIIHFVHN